MAGLFRTQIEYSVLDIRLGKTEYSYYGSGAQMGKQKNLTLLKDGVIPERYQLNIGTIAE